jgi:nicotinamidase/pyrazinamidase
MMENAIRPDDALVVVDLQYDFLPGGSLAVPDGDQVIAPINALVKCFKRAGAHVLLTQDWHPPGHKSFASSHEGREPFEQIEMPYGSQTLWPDHCVAGTRGAEITRNLEAANAELVIRKGYNPEVDSYSAFREADRQTPTGLAGYLRERGFKRVFCAGLATDFCVAWTAQDAVAAGFETFVVLDACRAIDTQGSLSRALAAMEREGVRVCSTSDILAEA